MILITTSRKPGRRTRSFSRDLARAIPGARYVTRGKGSIMDIVELAFAQGFFRVLIVGETKGNPSIIRGIEVSREPSWSIELYITGVRLCREINCSSHEGDFLLVEGETYHSPLKQLFETPIKEGEPVILKEEKTLAKFMYNGNIVGPLFRVRGWNQIPTRLRQQSSLKS